MASYQQIVVVGNVGNDPERRVTTGGLVCNFRVAVTEKWDGNEKTTWFRVAAWKKLGETCEQYVHKGMQIMVIGSIAASAYTNQNDEIVASLELNAFKVVFLGKREDSNQRNDSERDPDDIPF